MESGKKIINASNEKNSDKKNNGANIASTITMTRTKFDMINEKEEDEISEKAKKPVVKRPFLARGSGKAGGVGKPVDSLERPEVTGGVASPRDEMGTTAFGKKAKSVGIASRINATSRQSGTTPTNAESQYRNPYAGHNASSFDLSNKNNQQKDI